MRLSDRITGGVLVTLGAAAMAGGSRLPAVPGQDVGPAAFPMVIGGGLILCGALIALHVGRGFEEPDAEPERPGSGLLALLPPALLLFYVLAVDGLGFLVVAAVMVAATAFAFGAGARLALGVALIAPPAIHLVFAKLLRVPLPDGVLPAPW